MATSKLSLNAESGSDKFDWLIFKVRHPNTLPSPSPTETMHVIKLDWQKQQCRIVWSRAMMGRMECLAWIDDSFLQVEFSNSNFSSTLGNLPVQTSAVKFDFRPFLQVYVISCSQSLRLVFDNQHPLQAWLIRLIMKWGIEGGVELSGWAVMWLTLMGVSQNCSRIRTQSKSSGRLKLSYRRWVSFCLILMRVQKELLNGSNLASLCWSISLLHHNGSLMDELYWWLWHRLYQDC